MPLPQPYTLFQPHQGGVFTTGKGYIGTRNVGATIVIFIYDTGSKKCLAMHIDQGISTELVRTQIYNFFSHIADPKKCRAAVLGGWHNANYHDNRDRIFLEILHEELLNANIRYVTAPALDTVVLNLGTGELHHYRTQAQAEQHFTPNPLPLLAQAMYSDCMNYVNSNGPSLNAVIIKLQIAQMLEPRSQTHLEFFNTIIDECNGTAFISKDLIIDAHHQNVAITQVISRKEIMKLIRLLCANFINPVSKIYMSDGNTSLHFACSLLSTEPNNFTCKLMVLLVLMHGRRDFKNDHGQTALDALQDPRLNEFTELCAKLLHYFQSAMPAEENVSALCRGIMVLIADHVLKTPMFTQEEQQESEARIIRMVKNIMPSERAVHAAAVKRSSAESAALNDLEPPCSKRAKIALRG